VPGDYGFEHVYQLYTIRLKSNKLRNGLMKFLTKRGIMSKIYFDPIHKTPFYKKLGYSKNNLPITEKVSQEVLSLPIFPKMKSQEIKLIVETIEEYMK